MGKRRMVQYNLLKNAVAAYFATIEIHNKPNISYRYETVTLLLMNAWELALKAYTRKYIPKRSIFEHDGHTISLSKALDHVTSHINAKKPTSFMAIKESIIAVEEFRNNVAHFYCEDLKPCIFTLVARCALNFVEFLHTYFGRNIIAEEGIYIMPLGFSLPFNPEEFLSKTSPAYTSSSEARRFIDKIVGTITSLRDTGVEDSIVLGYGVYLQSVKKLENSDLLMKISPNNEAGIPVTTIKSVRLSDDPNAQAVTIDDATFRTQYPYTHKQVVEWCIANITGFKQGAIFTRAKRETKKHIVYAAVRRLDPLSSSSGSQTFYSKAAFDEIKRIYERGEQQDSL